MSVGTPLAASQLWRENVMKRLAVAMGFAALLSLALPSATFAQTSATPPPGATPPAPTGTTPGGTMPPPTGQVTTPGGAAPQGTTKPKKAEKQQLSKQQTRMKDCAHEAKAKGMKGESRKQFMSKCLKSE
jgi:hypothetical protein